MARDRLMVGGRCMAGVSQKGGRCEGSRVGLRMRLSVRLYPSIYAEATR
jgi:hypothetical protein